MIQKTIHGKQDVEALLNNYQKPVYKLFFISLQSKPVSLQNKGKKDEKKMLLVVNKTLIRHLAVTKTEGKPICKNGLHKVSSLNYPSRQEVR